MCFILIMGPVLLYRTANSDFKRDYFLSSGMGQESLILWLLLLGLLEREQRTSSHSLFLPWPYPHPSLEEPCEELACFMETEIPIGMGGGDDTSLTAKGGQE